MNNDSPVINGKIKNINHKDTESRSSLAKKLLKSLWLRGFVVRFPGKNGRA